MSLNIKEDFPIFQNNHQLIYLDSASTTQKPKQVINKLKECYSSYNANIHRAAYSIADKATHEYEQARANIASFINCKSNEIVFTKSTTESINLVAYSLANQLNENDEIIISEMEHHSNIIPWQMLQKNKKIKLRYIPVMKNGCLDLEKLYMMINEKTQIIAITQMSNILGTINPIKKIISKIKKQYNIKFLIDAAQSIAHLPIDVKKINCDFLVFSSHKIMGPFGVGVLYAKSDLLSTMDPFLYGGHMIEKVTKTQTSWNKIPWKFEAGTGSIAEVIAFSEAINYIKKIDLKNIAQHENTLLQYLIYNLKKIKNIEIYGHEEKSGPVVSFNIKNCHPYDIAKLLDTFNIAIRSGHHCSQILMDALKINYTNRISLYIYNTKSDIDFLIKSLNQVIPLLLK